VAFSCRLSLSRLQRRLSNESGDGTDADGYGNRRGLPGRPQPPRHPTHTDCPRSPLNSPRAGAAQVISARRPVARQKIGGPPARMHAHKRPRLAADVPIVFKKIYDQLDADPLDQELVELPEPPADELRIDYTAELAAIDESESENETDAREHHEENEPLDLYELWSLHFELSTRDRA